MELEVTLAFPTAICGLTGFLILAGAARIGVQRSR
jgi:hypothetical protein